MSNPLIYVSNNLFVKMADCILTNQRKYYNTLYEHIKELPTTVFFLFYSMLYHRKIENNNNTVKLTTIGWKPVLSVLHFIKYGVYEKVNKWYFNVSVHSKRLKVFPIFMLHDIDAMYEDEPYIKRDSTIGIAITYTEDPVNIVKRLNKHMTLDGIAHIIAACAGHVKCLDHTYTLEMKERNGIYLKGDENLYYRVVNDGHLACLKYLHENGHPFFGNIKSCDPRCQDYIDNVMKKLK